MAGIKLPQLQTKYKILIAVGAAAVGISFYYDYAYKPHAQKIKEVQEQLAVLGDTLNIICTVDYPGAAPDAGLLQKIQVAQNAELQRSRQEEANLPAPADLSLLLEKVTDLAQAAQVNLKSLEPKELLQKEFYKQQPLHLELEARYVNFLNFMQLINRLPVVMEKIKIELVERPKIKVIMQLAIIMK
ncbi:MAG: type 4a pilus biogenesis protein PilO [Candidatus Omnitrophica bacterium]|nr:type 4a pilus biogenesis protein PilO [Candidatus Omnitrophota bacterium]